jgi:hypothetical protein
VAPFFLLHYLLAALVYHIASCDIEQPHPNKLALAAINQKTIFCKNVLIILQNPNNE